jgi:hypothetical protein
VEIKWIGYVARSENTKSKRRNLVKNSEKGSHWEDLSIDGRVMLKEQDELVSLVRESNQDLGNSVMNFQFP